MINVDGEYLKIFAGRIKLMKAVILAAGLGTRLGGVPKPLVRVGGCEIILRTMKLLSPHVSEFIIVASRYADDIDAFLKDKGFNYKIVRHDRPEKGNGYSLLVAKNHVEDRFILTMGDHVYSQQFIEKAVRGEGVIADREPRFVDIGEATKIRVEDGRVAKIGKDLREFDCVDTGFFVLDDSIFEHAEKLRDREEIPLSEIVKLARLPVTYVDGELWMDVDTKEDVRRANRALVSAAVKGSGDGFISRKINRKISTRISAAIVNKVNPNQMTLISFLVGAFSALASFFSIPLAGLLYQFSSILDGCDGEIARASLNMSKKGGYVDSILDRFVDFLFLAIIALLYPKTATVAMFAIFGSVMVSYTSEKYKAEFGESIFGKFRILNCIPGKRDERIFLIMIFCLLSAVSLKLILWMFLTIAVISLTRVVVTLLAVLLAKQI